MSGVKFTDETNNNIADFCKTYNIPNPVPKNKLHSTVIFSRKHCPDLEPRGLFKQPVFGSPREFAVWTSQEGNKCLVLKYDCPFLKKRHEYLMDKHNATYDFDEYIPHVTLSYDYGDNDINSLDKFEIGYIQIKEEYVQDLDIDWARKNTGDMK